MNTASSPPRVGVIVGLGVIGSHLVSLLLRGADLDELVLVDFDDYAERNWTTQAMERRWVGLNKAQAQALQARRVNPRLRVRAVPERVEETPLGWLRGSVMVSAVDSLLARLHVNAAARRLGVPLVDVAVNGQTGRARVGVFLPQGEAACLECGMEPQEYTAMEQRHPCAIEAQATPAPPDAPPTRATAELGALAAVLAAAEMRKILAGDLAQAAVGRHVIYDLAGHKTFTTHLGAARADCRFDHRDTPWLIRPCNAQARRHTLGQAVGLLGGHHARPPVSVEVPGRSFALAGTCPACGRVESGLWLLPVKQVVRCGACAAPVRFLPRDLCDQVRFDALSATQRRLTLAQIGLREGDVLTVGDGQSDGGALALELVWDRNRRPPRTASGRRVPKAPAPAATAV